MNVRMTENEYDWRAEDDARTLRRYQEIKSDPDRLSRAQEVIKNNIEESKAILADKPLVSPTNTRWNNKATIGKLFPIV